MKRDAVESERNNNEEVSSVGNRWVFVVMFGIPGLLFIFIAVPVIMDVYNIHSSLAKNIVVFTLFVILMSVLVTVIVRGYRKRRSM